MIYYNWIFLLNIFLKSLHVIISHLSDFTGVDVQQFIKPILS